MRTFGAGLLSCFLLAAAAAHAQTPAPPAPLPGFMTPHEITKVVRSAGFDPLAPPLREGTTYVLRANDFRGILMRVVVDAHSGAIRAVNRIVPGPGSTASIGMVPPSYGAPPPYGAPPYGASPPYASADLDSPDTARGEENGPPPVPAAASHVAPHASTSAFPPLPRPRPTEVASGKATDGGTSRALKSESGATIAAPAVPNKAPVPAPLND